MRRTRRVGDALAQVGQAVGRRVGRQPRTALVARPAWAAWRAGDFTLARERAADLLASGQAVDKARHLLTLVDSVLGEHERAIVTHQLIDPGYGRLHELDEPILYDHLHRDDVAGALAFAEQRGLLASAVLAKRLRLAAERPFGGERTQCARRTVVMC
jgi:hypothetical protein